MVGIYAMRKVSTALEWVRSATHVPLVHFSADYLKSCLSRLADNSKHFPKDNPSTDKPTVVLTRIPFRTPVMFRGAIHSNSK